jgi:hypothetical protein
MNSVNVTDEAIRDFVKENLELWISSPNIPYKVDILKDRWDRLMDYDGSFIEFQELTENLASGEISRLDDEIYEVISQLP